MTKREATLSAVAILLLAFWFVIHVWDEHSLWDAQIYIDNNTDVHIMGQRMVNVEFNQRLYELERVSTGQRMALARLLMERNQVEEVVSQDVQ